MSRSEETFREAVPAHVLFKIEAFSLLPKNAVLKYESNEFEAGGYKWRLSFYPCGNKNETGNGHISLYLALVDTYLPASWELNVSLRLFLFDQIRDRYLIRGDVDGKTSRFHELKKVHGFPQFISLEKFKHPSNGYLVDDSCVFGAEVFVSKPMGNIECLSMVKQSTTVNHTWKIENFSKITQEVLRSQNFKAGDLNWKLSVYPDGNKNENGGKGHISLYLMLVNDSTSSLPVSWELNVFVKLFLFDQIRDRYLIRGDVEGKTRRFHEMKKVWGFPQFVSLSKFNDPKNGYLVDDTCVFGAEIFIAKPPRNIECLSMVKEATTVNFTWKIEKFSNLKEEILQSEKFKAGGHNWKVVLYPKGFGLGKGKSVSVYLQLADYKENLALKVLAYFKLRLRDQINNKHFEDSIDKYWFSASKQIWGWPMFGALTEMNNKKENGYLVKDTCIVEAEVKVLGVVSKRS